MPRRRLLFVLFELAFGGVERQAQLLAEAAHQQGHAVTLLVLGKNGPAYDRFAPCCEKIILLEVNYSNDYALHSAIQKGLEHSDFDAAFLFSTAKLPVLSHAIEKQAPVQLMHVGNPVEPNWIEGAKQMVRTLLFRPSRQLVLVANSQYTLQSLQKHFYYKHFPLACSLNSVHIPKDPAPLREMCTPLQIGMVARLDRIKDQATLIRAVAHARKHGQAVECELVGGGELEDSLKALAGELGLIENHAVRFVGWLADVQVALRRWDVFVFSTTAREGFGNAAAEAMAIGLPCIFTDVGPCREVGSDAVLYVPPEDPVALADSFAQLQPVEKRRELAEKARARAMHWFRAERNLEDFMQLAFSASQPTS